MHIPVRSEYACHKNSDDIYPKPRAITGITGTEMEQRLKVFAKLSGRDFCAGLLCARLRSLRLIHVVFIMVGLDEWRWHMQAGMVCKGIYVSACRYTVNHEWVRLRNEGIICWRMRKKCNCIKWWWFVRMLPFCLSSDNLTYQFAYESLRRPYQHIQQ